MLNTTLDQTAKQAGRVVQAFKQLFKAKGGHSIKQSFARFLFGYSTTVQTPCVLFLNPRFKTRLDLVCPDLGGKVFDKQSYQKFRMDKGGKEREHSANEFRFKTFEEKWFVFTATEQTDPVF